MERAGILKTKARLTMFNKTRIKGKFVFAGEGGFRGFGKQPRKQNYLKNLLMGFCGENSIQTMLRCGATCMSYSYFIRRAGQIP